MPTKVSPIALPKAAKRRLAQTFKPSQTSRLHAFKRKDGSFVTYDVKDPAFRRFTRKARQPARPHDFSKVVPIDYTEPGTPAHNHLRTMLGFH